MNYSSKYIAALGRLALAAIFLASGIQKLLTPEQTQSYIASANIPQPFIAYWASTAVEVLGGLSVALGFAPRIGALVLAVFSVAAAIIFHTNFGDQNQMIHFMKDIAIAGGLLQVVAFGSGGLAIANNGSRDV
jgi:putative oxidoreductase